MKNRIKNKLTDLLLVAVIGMVPFLIPRNLSAQVVCSGPSCAALPLSNQDLNELLLQFQMQYLDSLASDMSEAGNSAVLSGVPGSPMMEGSYFVNFTLPLAYKSRHDVWIASPKYQATTALESAGVAVLPRLQIGYHYDPEKKEGEELETWQKLLTRFELFASYFNYTYEKKVQLEFDPGRLYSVDTSTIFSSATTGGSSTFSSLLQPQWDKAIAPGSGYKLQWKHTGATARFRILDPFDLAGPMVEFGGLSGSIGYYQDAFSVDALTGKETNSINVTGGDSINWDYNLFARYRADTRTIPMEIRSGVTLLTFLRLNAGAGVSYTQGRYTIDALMGGPYTVKAGGLLGQLAALSAPVQDPSSLFFYMKSQKPATKWTPYFRPGVEFQMGVVRVSLEGIMTRGAADTFILSFSGDF